MSAARESEVRTIAAVYVDADRGVLMVKPIKEENHYITTRLLQATDDSSAIKVDAKGGISVQKIVELLGAMQEQAK